MGERRVAGYCVNLGGVIKGKEFVHHKIWLLKSTVVGLIL